MERLGMQEFLTCQLEEQVISIDCLCGFIQIGVYERTPHEVFFNINVALQN